MLEVKSRDSACCKNKLCASSVSVKHYVDKHVDMLETLDVAKNVGGALKASWGFGIAIYIDNTYYSSILVVWKNK